MLGFRHMHEQHDTKGEQYKQGGTVTVQYVFCMQPFMFVSQSKTIYTNPTEENAGNKRSSDHYHILYSHAVAL